MAPTMLFFQVRDHFFADTKHCFVLPVPAAVQIAQLSYGNRAECTTEVVETSADETRSYSSTLCFRKVLVVVAASNEVERDTRVAFEVRGDSIFRSEMGEKCMCLGEASTTMRDLRGADKDIILSVKSSLPGNEAKAQLKLRSIRLPRCYAAGEKSSVPRGSLFSNINMLCVSKGIPRSVRRRNDCRSRGTRRSASRLAVSASFLEVRAHQLEEANKEVYSRVAKKLRLTCSGDDAEEMLDVAKAIAWCCAFMDERRTLADEYRELATMHRRTFDEMCGPDPRRSVNRLDALKVPPSKSSSGDDGAPEVLLRLTIQMAKLRHGGSRYTAYQRPKALQKY